MAPVPRAMYPHCAGLWVQEQDGGNVCSHLCQIQQVPGADMLVSILGDWCPFWDADTRCGMLVSILGCRYCTRIWIPLAGCSYKTMYQDVGTGIHVPVLGCSTGNGILVPIPRRRSCTGMQGSYQDPSPIPGCEYQCCHGEQDAQSYSGMQVLGQDMDTSTGMWVPILGCRCHMGMQVSCQDVITRLGYGYQCQDAHS